MDRLAPIGMFDSGAGGISVLKEAIAYLPQEQFIFYGDTLNAPYGTRPKEEVYALSKAVVEELIARDAKAVVIACNTATSAAAARLRAEYDFPIIGMEPALKPASLLHKDGVVLSLATPGTIAGEKYAQLYSVYGEGVISLPCPGLMEFVENGEMVEKLNAILHEHGQWIIGRMGIPYRKRNVSIIAIALEAPQNTISALAGKVGSLPGISVKTAYSSIICEE